MSAYRSRWQLAGVLVTASLFLATSADAFQWQKGNRVVVKTAETINDDLYATGSEIIIDGTVNGDVFAFGNQITVNGTIKGSLFSAGQNITVNGAVTGSIRMAGSELYLGEKATIGRDILAAGGSFESAKESTVGRDIIVAGGQILLNGAVLRDVLATADGLEIRGTITGNVNAKIGEAGGEAMGYRKSGFSSMVKKGLTIAPTAKISGTLNYTQSKDLIFPPGVITGAVTRTASEWAIGPLQKSPAASWAMDFLRSLLSLLLIGLLLIWLFPKKMASLANQLRSRPLPSLLWGFITFAAFIAAVILICIVSLFGAVLLGLLSLGGLAGITIALGLITNLSLILGFVFTVIFLAKIILGLAIGTWLLSIIKPSIAEHRFFPMLVGVSVLALAVAMVSLPFVPGVLASLVKSLIVLLGLGAIWLRLRRSEP